MLLQKRYLSTAVPKTSNIPIEMIRWASELTKQMLLSDPLAKVHPAAMPESLCYALRVRAMVIRMAVPGK